MQSNEEFIERQLESLRQTMELYRSEDQHSHHRNPSKYDQDQSTQLFVINEQHESEMKKLHLDQNSGRQSAYQTYRGSKKSKRSIDYLSSIRQPDKYPEVNVREWENSKELQTCKSIPSFPEIQPNKTAQFPTEIKYLNTLLNQSCEVKALKAGNIRVEYACSEKNFKKAVTNLRAEGIYINYMTESMSLITNQQATYQSQRQKCSRYPKLNKKGIEIVSSRIK